MIRVVNLPNLSGSAITAGAGFNAHTMTCDLPVGPRYHVAWIKGRAGAAKKMTDLIGEIRVKVNGKVQRVFTADELNKLNILNGSEYAAIGAMTNDATFELPIYFAEPWRKSVAAQDGLAWATGAESVSTFQIEIDIKAYAGATAGVTTPTMKAEIDDSIIIKDNKEIEQGLGLITKVYNVQIPTASGWNDFMQLPKVEPYTQISLVDYTNFVEFELKLNNTIFRQDTKAGNESRLTARGLLPAPSNTATPANLAADINVTRGMIDIVFDHDDLLTNLLPMRVGGKRVTDFNLRINTTTVGNIKCIYQTVGPAD